MCSSPHEYPTINSVVDFFLRQSFRYKGGNCYRYFAQVDGIVDEASLEKLRNGVEIGIRDQKYITKPCRVELVNETPDFPPRTRKIRDDRHGPTCWISITLTEGKNRQVRKMTAAVGFPTLRSPWRGRSMVRFHSGATVILGAETGCSKSV